MDIADLFGASYSNFDVETTDLHASDDTIGSWPRFFAFLKLETHMAPRRMVGGRLEWSFPATCSRLLGRSHSIAREPASAIVYPDGSPRDWRRQIDQWWTVTVWADGEGRERKADLMTSRSYDTHEQPSRWERLTLAAGILAAVLYIAATALFIAYILPDMPTLDAPAVEAATFYAQQSENGIYMVISHLGATQMMFLLLFFGGLFGILRRAEQGSGSLAAAVFAAGIAVSIITPIAILIEDHVLLGLAANGVDPVIVRAFDGIVPVSVALTCFPQAVALGGTAALILSTRLAPRWLGWMGVVTAVLCLAGTVAFPLASLATLLFRLWILALSVALLRTPGTESRPLAQVARAQ